VNVNCGRRQLSIQQYIYTALPATSIKFSTRPVWRASKLVPTDPLTTMAGTLDHEAPPLRAKILFVRTHVVAGSRDLEKSEISNRSPRATALSGRASSWGWAGHCSTSVQVFKCWGAPLVHTKDASMGIPIGVNVHAIQLQYRTHACRELLRSDCVVSHQRQPFANKPKPRSPHQAANSRSPPSHARCHSLRRWLLLQQPGGDQIWSCTCTAPLLQCHS